MIEDIRTVAWKEFAELLRVRADRKGAVARLLLLAVVGWIFVRMLGPGFGTSHGTILLVSFVACLFVLPTVTESFAGERERHTLETLLATRIPDPAVLLGKFATHTLFGWTVGLAVLVGGLLLKAVLHPGSPEGFADAGILALSAVISLLAAGLVSAVGIHVSLRAPTVRHATEHLTLLMIAVVSVPFVLEQVIPPGTVEAFLPRAVALERPGIMLLGAAQLLVLDAAVLGAAMLRFKRSRLVSQGSPAPREPELGGA